MNNTHKRPSTVAIADGVMRAAYAAHGMHTLACECGDREVVIDGDAIGNTADVLAVAGLLEHARHDHVTPRDVIAAVHVVAYNTAALDHSDGGRDWSAVPGWGSIR